MSTDTGIRLLEDISFSLDKGSQMALVGFSGSGKSTLAQCIGQLCRYTGGEVYLDKMPVSDLTKHDILANVGFVAQSPFIFAGTIEENLLYSRSAQKEAGTRPDMPTLDDIIAVLQHTGLFTDVLKFGLNTVLSGKTTRTSWSALSRFAETSRRSSGNPWRTMWSFTMKTPTCFIPRWRTTSVSGC